MSDLVDGLERTSYSAYYYCRGRSGITVYVEFCKIVLYMCVARSHCINVSNKRFF